jgi:hypothetical protein
VLIRMDVTPKTGAKRTIVAEAQDLVAFEREFNKSVARFQDDVFLTDLFWLAWHVEKRSSTTSLEFDAWIATMTEIGVSDDQALVPLESKAPTG